MSDLGHSRFKGAKQIGKQIVKGDWEGLQEKAKDRIAQSSTALKQKLAPDSLIDERVRREHERLVQLHGCTNDLLASLKHQSERAQRDAKVQRELGGVLRRCMPLVVPAPGEQSLAVAQVAQSERHSLALCDAHCEAGVSLEMLVASAKSALSMLFSEGTGLYNSYLRTVSELASKQSKERRAGGVASLASRAGAHVFDDKLEGAQEATAELRARKAREEAETTVRLATIFGETQQAVGMLLERHGALQAARPPARPAHQPPDHALRPPDTSSGPRGSDSSSSGARRPPTRTPPARTRRATRRPRGSSGGWGARAAGRSSRAR